MLPQIVNIELTNNCNATCIFCTNRIMTRPRGFMSWETFSTCIDKLSNIPFISQIQLHGHGESFLHPNFIQFSEYAKSKCPNKIISVITNGSVIKEFPKALDSIGISFHGGTKENYENLTGLNFDKTIANIKRFDTFKDKITLVFLVNELNKHTQDNFKELWKGWNYGFQSAYYNWGELQYFGSIEEQEVKYCDRLDCHMFITWSGLVGLCCMDYNCTEVLGNMLEQSVEEMYNGVLITKKRTEQKQKVFTGICSKCNYCKLC